MMRVFSFAIYFFMVGLSAPIGAQIPSEEPHDQEAAKAVAQAYDNLFSQDEAFDEALGGSAYNAIFYDLEGVEPEQITEDQRQMAIKHVEGKLDRLSDIATAPRVDWGRKEDFEKKGFAALIPSVGPIRRLALEASWYAGETWETDPQKALASLRHAQAAARHVGQDTPSLITTLTQISSESILLNKLAELGPQMNEQQMASALAGIEGLPVTGSLADAIRTERDLMIGWFRNKIEGDLKAWERSASGTSDFRFPEDLRLAGVVLLPKSPVRLSLHNTRGGQTFWLEEGKEVNGIRIERVEHHPPRAWITYGNRRAIVNLEKETIQNRRVPWEVLISAFGSLNGNEIGDLSDAEKEKIQEQLIEFGLSPDTALDSLDRLEAFYTGAIQRLHLPLDKFEAWEEDYMDEAGENTFLSSMAPSLSRVIEVNRAFQEKYEALETGFAIQSGGLNPESMDENFTFKRNKNGFTITPKQFVGHPREHDYSLHFGTPPPEPDE